MSGNKILDLRLDWYHFDCGEERHQLNNLAQECETRENVHSCNAKVIIYYWLTNNSKHVNKLFR